MYDAQSITVSNRIKATTGLPFQNLPSLAKNPRSTFRKNDIKSNPFKCMECTRSFKHRKILNHHMQQMHIPGRSWRCHLCYYSSKSKIRLTHHKKTSHELFLCTECDFSSKDKYIVDAHVSKHKEERAFKCSMCPVACKHRYLLRKHMLTHKDGEDSKNDGSQFTAETKYNLIEYTRRRSKEPLYKCKSCVYSTNDKNSLQIHHRKHKGFSLTYFCDFCEYRTWKGTQLLNHMAVHGSFECGVCKVVFEDANSYLNHAKSHKASEAREFNCEKCNFSSSFKGCFRRHQLNCNSMKTFDCDWCDFKSVLKQQLVSHLKIHRPLKCPLCGSIFKEGFHYVKHKKIHGVESRLFKCTLCSFVTTKENTLYNHAQRHEARPTFSCVSCQFKSLSKKELLIHMTAHEPFKCDICKMIFDQGRDYLKHLKANNMHNTDHQFKCPKCDFTTDYKQSLIKHAAKHGKTMQFICCSCDRGFFKKQGLLTHMILHNSLTCRFCQRVFKKGKSYLKHLRIHSMSNSDQLFQCSLCSFYTNYGSVFKIHQKKHNGKMPFACDFCSYKALAKQLLTRHLAVHKPLRCKFCLKIFKHPLVYLNHMKIHNKEKNEKNRKNDKKLCDDSVS